MEEQTKGIILKEIRYLINLNTLDNLTEDTLSDLLKAIKQIMYPDPDQMYPVLRFNGGICCLSELIPGEKLSAALRITNKEDRYLSVETLNQIMDYYGVHGQQRITYSVSEDAEEKGYNAWVNVYAGKVPDYWPQIPKLSPRQTEALNLKAEGRTQKEIAAAIGCSVTTLVASLHKAYRIAERYGFRQIWPESVEMKYTEGEYDRTQRQRGKAKERKKDE